MAPDYLLLWLGQKQQLPGWAHTEDLLGPLEAQPVACLSSTSNDFCKHLIPCTNVFLPKILSDFYFL